MTEELNIKVELEHAFVNDYLDPLYADYIIRNSDDKHMVGNSSILFDLMGDLYLHKEFMQSMIDDPEYAKKVIEIIKKENQ